ncbi:MAG: response regulator [Deltaproteobacteria bacterium]|nr:response regulator [Deltaproteobacteria bacterium]
MPDDETGYDPYRELFERSADAILIIEGDRFIDCNEAAVRMFRAKNREHVLQTHPSELSPVTQECGRDSREMANEMIAKAFADGVHRFEWMHRRADSVDFPAEVSLTSVRSGGHMTLHSIVRDISDRRRLEEELRHTQKMEAIGKLAGGIAHDFNNLLVAILGHAELLSCDLRDQPALLTHVREIHNAGNRAADLVRQLMLFGRKGARKKSIFDLGELLRESKKLLERVIGEDVRLEIEIESTQLHIEADSTQLQQVVMNLASNARDAMPRGGELELRLRSVVRRGGDLDVDALSPGGYAELCVSDTGEGMDAETMRHAFDPFFTTKAVGKGTGLGLATVHGVVERAGGRVSVRSAPGQGTTFEILLPLVDAPLTEKVIRDSSPSAGAGETLLVVEDEKAVSRLVVEALEGAGYRVMVAHDGNEALSIFDEHHAEIDLVLSDVIMPELGGPAFLRELAKRGEHPRALLMSGYTGDALERSEDLPPEVELLEKPFSPRELLQRLRTLLDR